ncbi:hypothetical protein [Noviherbaspirillum sp.]|uniref:hypothetical protein n=1 Tax=Noviherbaspirillum sp. TaxID=1926288 RepID=UPI002FE11F43
MTVGVLPGDLAIAMDEQGKNTGSLTLSTAYNVVPIWLKIAHDSLKQSKLASTAISERWSEDPSNQKQLLMGELAPSIQVYVACGIALDGLYETLRPYAKISLQEIEAWKRNKTSRAKQIAEFFRRTHKIKNDIFDNFCACIDQIIKYRDKAVHPSLKLENSCSRPDVDVAVDWKFSAYRFSNAERCFTNTVNIVAYLYENKSVSAEVNTSLSNIIEALEELKVVQRNA